MRAGRLVSKRIRNFETALPAPIRDAGNCPEPTVRPECGWRFRASDIQPRQQPRGEQMTEPLDARQPGPCRMPLDCLSKRTSDGGFIVEGARVGPLQNTGCAGGLALSNCLEKRVGILDAGDQLGKRSALKNCAQALAMGDPRCLRLLVQLIQQAKLRRGVRSVTGRVKFFEGD